MQNSLSTQNFTLWQTALLTRDPEQVADLYTENATLLPTMAQKVMTDRQGIIAYFTFFESFLPSVSMVEEHVIPISDDSYVHCGVYRFQLTRDGKPEEVDARFTMVWEKIGETWKMLHHHSSRIPVV
jgi:uncharacterized protein (TIGR02246 family)